MTLSNGDGDVPGPSSASAACIPPPLSASVDPSRHGNANTFRMIGIVALIAVVMLVGVVVVRHPNSSPSPSVLVFDGSSSAPQQQQLRPPPSSASSVDALRAQMGRLQYQMSELRSRLSGGSSAANDQELWPVYYSDQQQRQQEAIKRHVAWQPMRKRRIAWQPMKRNDPQMMAEDAEAEDGARRREHVMRAVEHELAVVLRAGERLGVSAPQILAHLRAQNEVSNGGVAEGEEVIR